MKCSVCKKDLPEQDIQLSHDVPCYLFQQFVRRNERKNLADKYCRRWLCFECHVNYEQELQKELIKKSVEFAKRYFKDDSF